MRRSIFLVPALLTLTACEDDGSRRVSRDAPPPAAVVAPGQRAAQLPDQLEGLAAELETAMRGEPDHLLTAEAITDQLIHAPRSVDWLAIGYDVEARLRQLQAMADGLVARLRRGATLDDVGEEVELLLTAVRDLQGQLRLAGGGAAPPTLDSLLAQDPLRDVGAASLGGLTGSSARSDTASGGGGAAGGGRSGPLGTPVRVAPDTSSDGR